MFDSVLKYITKVFTGPSAWISILVLIVVCIATFFIWRQLTSVTTEVIGLKKNQNALKRQITHGIIVDDDSSRVDLKVSTSTSTSRPGDDSSDFSDETPDIDEKPAVKAHVPQAPGGKEQPVSEYHNQQQQVVESQQQQHQQQQQQQQQQQVIGSQQHATEIQELLNLKKPVDEKLIDLDELSKVSSVEDDLSSSSSASESEEDIQFTTNEHDNDDHDEDEQTSNIKSNLDIESKILEDMKHLDEESEKIMSTNADDDVEDDDQSPLQQPQIQQPQLQQSQLPETSPQKTSFIPKVKLGGSGQKPKPKVSEAAATFKAKPVPISIKPKSK